MLPKLDVPIYEVKLISNDKVVRFRPFLVKEQKLLLMGSQSEDSEENVKIVKQVLKNCVIDELDIDSLATFDLEYLFLNLRARSVNEVIELKYKCNNIVKQEDDKEEPCNSLETFGVKLLDIKPTTNDKHDKKIELSEKMGIVMKYPTFEIVSSLPNKSEDEVLMILLLNCIDYIYDAENIYKIKDVSQEEVTEFIDNLQQKDLEKIQTFFETSPKLRHTLNFNCKKCDYKEDINVEGLQNFFI